MQKTTIQISPETLERLRLLKRYERESYEELLNNLLDEYEEDNLDEREIEEIKEALEEVRQGKTRPFDEIIKELRINLS